MRRAFVAEDDPARAFLRALSLAPHQHLDAAGQAVDLILLACDNRIQLFYRAGQMGDLFFQMLHGALLKRVS